MSIFFQTIYNIDGKCVGYLTQCTENSCITWNVLPYQLPEQVSDVSDLCEHIKINECPLCNDRYYAYTNTETMNMCQICRNASRKKESKCEYIRSEIKALSPNTEDEQNLTKMTTLLSFYENLPLDDWKKL